MLRWYQSTLRILDGHGCNYASTLPHYSSRRRRATLTIYATSPLSRSQTSTQSRSIKRLVPQTVGSQLESNDLAAARETLREWAPKLTPAGVRAETSSPTCNFELRSKIQDETFSSNIPNTIQADLDLPPTALAHLSQKIKFHSPGYPNETDSIAKLYQLLSPYPAEQDRSISDVFTAYNMVSKRSVLIHLGAEQFSTLLRLCGTLLLSSTETASPYINSLTSRFVKSSESEKIWSFMFEVGKDKEKLGHGLDVEDRYWITQACLAQVQSVAGDKLHSALSHALSHYQHLKQMSDNPILHLPYLQILMTSGNITNIQEGVNHLCNIMDTVPDLHPRFPELFWRTILSHELSTDSKERISQTAFNRIAICPTTSSFGSVTISSLTPDIIRQGLLRIPHLSAAFAATLFPCYTSYYPTECLGHWATQQARQALSLTLPLDIRWNNIVLLATSMSPESFPVKYRSSNTASPDSGNSLWRTALILESMDRKMVHAGPDFGPLSRTVQSIARPLWKMFLTAKHENQPVDINRAYVSEFLRIAAKSYDEQLKGQCFSLSQSLALWHCTDHDTQATKAQAMDAIATYAKAFVACEGRDWHGLYSSISCHIPDINWQVEVTNGLLHHYANSENVDIAYDLYAHSLAAGINPSSHALRSLFMGLVRHGRWEIVIIFLEHPTTSRAHLELLFGEILRIFQIQRYEFAEPAFVRLLAQTACRLYEHQPPPPYLKYPIRYFFSIMIWTQNTANLVKLVKAVRQTAPSFFNVHLVQRLILQLVHRQDLLNAVELFHIFDGAGQSSLSRPCTHLYYKLMLRFSKLGAFRLAAGLRQGHDRTAIHSFGWRMIFPFRQIVARVDKNSPTIREAVSILIRAKRTYSARKLYAKSRTQLNEKTSTAIGNIILHGPMHDTKFRRGRLVRHILRTMDLLTKDYDFAPDRATLNILLKAILRSKPFLDPRKVRNLFDKMVHEGYPVPEQFRRNNGVPFNSPPGSFNEPLIPSLSSHFSFSRHIRPMYKMFIKSFYLGGDASAAKTVVGILKEVEIQEMRAREKRSQARREGVIKKRARMLDHSYVHKSP